MSSKRQIQTGGTYQLPPRAQGIEPDYYSTLAEWQQVITAAADQVGHHHHPAAQQSLSLSLNILSVLKVVQTQYLCGKGGSIRYNLKHN